MSNNSTNTNTTNNSNGNNNNNTSSSTTTAAHIESVPATSRSKTKRSAGASVSTSNTMTTSTTFAPQSSPGAAMHSTSLPVSAAAALSSPMATNGTDLQIKKRRIDPKSRRSSPLALVSMQSLSAGSRNSPVSASTTAAASAAFTTAFLDPTLQHALVQFARGAQLERARLRVLGFSPAQATAALVAVCCPASSVSDTLDINATALSLSPDVAQCLYSATPTIARCALRVRKELLAVRAVALPTQPTMPEIIAALTHRLRQVRIKRSHDAVAGDMAVAAAAAAASSSNNADKQHGGEYVSTHVRFARVTKRPRRDVPVNAYLTAPRSATKRSWAGGLVSSPKSARVRFGVRVPTSRGAPTVKVVVSESAEPPAVVAPARVRCECGEFHDDDDDDDDGDENDGENSYVFSNSSSGNSSDVGADNNDDANNSNNVILINSDNNNNNNNNDDDDGDSDSDSDAADNNNANNDANGANGNALIDVMGPDELLRLHDLFTGVFSPPSPSRNVAPHDNDDDESSSSSSSSSSPSESGGAPGAAAVPSFAIASASSALSAIDPVEFAAVDESFSDDSEAVDGVRNGSDFAHGGAEHRDSSGVVVDIDEIGAIGDDDDVIDDGDDADDAGDVDDDDDADEADENNGGNDDDFNANNNSSDLFGIGSILEILKRRMG